MRKLVLVGLFALIAATGLLAQSSDDFTITVTVNYIDFQLMEADSATGYGNWALGNLNAGGTAEMTTGGGGDHIYVQNHSNVALDFSAYSSSPAPAGCGYGTATAWSPGAAAGVDTYLLEMDKGEATTVPASYTTIDATDMGSADLFYSTLAGESYHLYTKFTAPTSATDGCEHTITVNVIAVAP